MNKVIMVVCDALRDDTAAATMGYLQHIVEVKHASRYTVIAELPTMSRPLYETLHTGVPCSQHGVTNNQIVRRSIMPNVFELARAAGKVTAASAFYWYSELYNRVPYDPLADGEVDNPDLAIQHGRFYMSESYPDLEVFLAGGMLLRRFAPDYLLIHPMAMDYIGERFGSDSSEYRNNAIVQDQIMANLIPPALQAGYTILVTADHGISTDKTHGGTLPAVRHVPLYFIPADGNARGDTRESVTQCRIAPTLCHLLGMETPPTMTEAPILPA
ncbi:MAG: alkaline phosphatase family protein [Ardenticatenales bacterium]|nr:alkaline phosphatase family protein [Ardenticatenales bacterium]